MSKIDDLLKKEKERIDRVQTPENMEMKLKSSLHKSTSKHKKKFRFKLAAIVLIFILLGYNFDSLAYYGKQFIGYEDVMTGTLKELNEQGLGQKIDKSYTFKNGAKFTLDGVIIDRNKMVMFYSLYSKDRKTNETLEGMEMSIESIESKLNCYYSYNSESVINDDETVIKTILSTDKSPKFFEKNLDVNISYQHKDGNVEYAKVSFDLEKDEALKKSIKLEIDKNIQITKEELKIRDLIASPTSTVIRGEIQNIFELALSYIKKDRSQIEEINMILIANGQEMDIVSSSMSTNLKGTYFELWFDALPEEIETLELKLVSVKEELDVDRSIQLELGMSEEFKVLDEKIFIENVYEENENTFVVIKTDEETKISGINLNIDGKKINLEGMIDMGYGEINEDEQVFQFIRALEFKGRGEKIVLNIDNILYKKRYDNIFYKYSEKER